MPQMKIKIEEWSRYNYISLFINLKKNTKLNHYEGLVFYLIYISNKAPWGLRYCFSPEKKWTFTVQEM